jgi:hypothetical protein
MANIIAPRGFVPSRYRAGNAWTGGTNLYVVQAAEPNQINVGDAVKSSANGDANGIPAVTKITNGTDTIRGIVVGVLVAGPNLPSLVGVNLDLTIQNIPATKAHDYYVLVVDDMDVLYELADDGLNVLTATSCNKNASFTVTNPTSPQQNSATVLNTASVATTSTLNLRLQGLVQKPNNAYGVNAAWLVMINQHELMGNTAGV